jgi:hypothetical protein
MPRWVEVRGKVCLLRPVSRDWIALAAAVVAPLAVSAALVPFRPGLTSTTTALVLVVGVVAVAALGNRLAGAIAALSAAACFEFFFTQPYQHFAIADSADVQAAVLMLLVGLVVSQLAARARRLQVLAVTEAGYLSRLHEMAELARSTRSPNVVVDQVRQQLTDLLELRECRFEYGRLVGHLPRLEQDGTVVAGLKRWDAARGLPDREIELRAYGNGRFYGRFLLQPRPGATPPLQARLVALTLADLAGAALDTAGTTRDSG